MSHNTQARPSDRCPPCPVCHDLNVRETTPAVPEFSKYECNRCGHTWSDE